MVRARPVAYASAQRPLRTSYLIGLWRPQVGAIIQLPWAMVVMQPWLRERRLSVGAAARGQYYLSDVNFGAPPPLGPHFPRPIRPEPPSSHPLQRADSNLYVPCRYRQMASAPSPTAAQAPPAWRASPPPLPSPPLPSPAALTTLFSILRPSQFGAPAAVHMAWAGIRPLGGLGGSRAAPGGLGPVS